MSNRFFLKRLFCVLILLPVYELVNGQILDSLQIKVGTTVAAASKEYQPFWVVSKRSGVLSDQQMDASSFISIKNKSLLFRKKETSYTSYPTNDEGMWLEYGMEAYNNNHSKSTFIKEGYTRLRFGNWKLAAGRFVDSLSGLDRDLSLGSFGISNNALPIPKIQFAVDRFMDVPFTNGLFQFKGSFAHGWFGNNRYMQDGFYHEKTFYLNVGSPRIRFYGGLEHFAEWGGSRRNKTYDRTWRGFKNVVFVKEADDGSVGTAINGLRPSRAGDQRGLVAAGVVWNGDMSTIHAYAQMPFESGEELDMKNRSSLAGISLVNKSSSPLKKVLAEVLYTKQMNDFIGPKQRQSYYNNGLYKTGWEYNERVIGMPLFTNRARAQKYFPDITPFDWKNKDTTYPGNQNIINNRIIAGHVGVHYDITASIACRSLLTYTVNYGDLNPDSPFRPNEEQIYALQEFVFKPVHSRWNVNLGLAFDYGQLSKNVGTYLGFTYNFFDKIEP